MLFFEALLGSPKRSLLALEEISRTFMFGMLKTAPTGSLRDLSEESYDLTLVRWHPFAISLTLSGCTVSLLWAYCVLFSRIYSTLTRLMLKLLIVGLEESFESFLLCLSSLDSSASLFI